MIDETATAHLDEAGAIELLRQLLQCLIEPPQRAAVERWGEKAWQLEKDRLLAIGSERSGGVLGGDDDFV